VALNLSRIDPQLKTIARNLPRVAASQGFQVRITSGWRSYATQNFLYRQYLAGKSTYPANPPGTSKHEKGLALDILSTNTNALVKLLTSVGLVWAGTNDPIHFQIGPLGGPRTNDLGPVKGKVTVPVEPFWTSFQRTSKAIVGAVGYLPTPLGLAASISNFLTSL
jgi:hypothetical protein